MDSMRSLNTSLPAAYSSRPVPREQLLQAFKTAALSVTNLYKSAAADQQSSRDAGYQDALEDLLRMMDSENLGVQDGEGWRIRQWVTERYDHSANNTTSSDTDDNRTAAADPGRDDTVDEDTSADRSLNDASSDTEVPERHEQPAAPQPRPDSAPPMFKFTAGPSSASAPSRSSSPDNDDMQVNDGPSKPVEGAEPVLPPPPPIQVQLINRANRTTQRNNNQRHGRPPGRTPASTAGTKRKLYQVPDFFDIPNFNFRDDPDNGSGGGKRSRMV